MRLYKMSRKNIVITGCAIVLVILLLIIIPFSCFKKEILEQPTDICEKDYPVFQKGMTYATWNRTRYEKTTSDESLEDLANTGTEYVALITTWYQDKFNSREIYATENTPSEEGIVHAIDTIHSLGMKVMLKPHLDILDRSQVRWRGEIDFASTREWEEWFKSYSNFILNYAKIAQDNNVEMFCIGTELTYPATVHNDKWRKLIKDIKEIYSGKLTYAANWNEEYMLIEFWDLLDYAGIDPYFPLSEEDDPSLEQIKQGWLQWVEEIETWQEKVNKPVIFTECGYASILGTARTPWESDTKAPVSLELQEKCYKALIETFGNKDWFYGTYWWYWGTNKRMGGSNNKGFLIQNKPAVEVVKKWYAEVSK
jgi:hypothetical protein